MALQRRWEADSEAVVWLYLKLLLQQSGSTTLCSICPASPLHTALSTATGGHSCVVYINDRAT